MKISFVTSLYRSAPYIEELCTRSRTAAERLMFDYEVILVNDDSPDDSLAIALSLHARDQCVKVVELARNFGQHKAMMTGLSYADGDLVFLLDSDLEEEPEWIDPFYQELVRQDADVVYGVQKVRRGKWIERLSGEFFYTSMRYLTDQPVPRNIVTARLMRRPYVRALISHREREIFIAGLWQITGFKQVPFVVTKLSHSSTTYNLARKLSITVNAITSFSNRPLVAIFYLGSAIVLLAGAAATVLIVRVLFLGSLLAGYASIIVSLWLLGGMIIFCLGIIGIYLAKIFTETKQRPYTIVRRYYAGNEEHKDEQ